MIKRLVIEWLQRRGYCILTTEQTQDLILELAASRALVKTLNDNILLSVGSLP